MPQDDFLRPAIQSGHSIYLYVSNENKKFAKKLGRG